MDMCWASAMDFDFLPLHLQFFAGPLQKLSVEFLCCIQNENHVSNAYSANSYTNTACKSKF